MTYVLIHVVLIITGFVKLLYFIRINTNLGLLVRMVATTIIDCIPFLIFFGMFVFLFTVLNMTFMIEVETEEYMALPKLLQMLLMTYRNSIGDISVPSYKSWLTFYSEEGPYPSHSHSVTVLLLVWGVWFLNQLTCLIILLNFLIAVISQGYDNVIAEQIIDYFMSRAEMNYEFFMMQAKYNLI